MLRLFFISLFLLHFTLNAGRIHVSKGLSACDVSYIDQITRQFGPSKLSTGLMKEVYDLLVISKVKPSDARLASQYFKIFDLENLPKNTSPNIKNLVLDNRYDNISI